MSKPLQELKDDIMRTMKLDFTGSFDTSKPFVRELSRISNDYGLLKSSLGEFKCFVPPHIVGELVQGNSKRGVSTNQVSLLFCDIANFTQVTHKVEPSTIAKFANAFLGGAADLMAYNNGTVIDFFGDQIFGIFNAPFPDADYAKKTLKCASELLTLFEKVKKQFVADFPCFSDVDVRIGLHCGPALTGKIGSESRLKYCAVGDNVNLGSRIENMNKRYGSRLACSDAFFKEVGSAHDQYLTRPLEYVKVQGRSEPVLIYEIGETKSTASAAMQAEYRDHADVFFKASRGEIGAPEIQAFIEKTKKKSRCSQRVSEFIMTAIDKGEKQQEIVKQED